MSCVLLDRIKADPSINWPDISYFFRSFDATYRGKIFTIPLDGDIHFLYYRADVLQQYGMYVPKTFEELVQAIVALNGTVLSVCFFLPPFRFPCFLGYV